MDNQLCQGTWLIIKVLREGLKGCWGSGKAECEKSEFLFVFFVDGREAV